MDINKNMITYTGDGGGKKVKLNEPLPEYCPTELIENEDPNEPTSIFGVEYDANDNDNPELLQKYYESKNSTELYEEVYDYDDDGNKDKIIEYKNGKRSYATEYDKTGKITGYILYDSKGELAGQIKPEYDDTGKKIKDVVWDKNGNIEEQITYQYNPEGKLTKEIKFDKNGKFEEQTEYQYDDEGKYIGHLRIDKNGVDSGVTRTFDENGEIKTENWDYGEYGYTYHFDENGERTRSDFYDLPGGRFYPTERDD